MKKGKCSCCGSEAHLTRDCAQRYYPDPSVPRPPFSSSSSSSDNNRSNFSNASNNQGNSNRNARRINNRRWRNTKESNDEPQNDQTSSSSTSERNSENEIQRSSVVVHSTNLPPFQVVPELLTNSASTAITTSKIALSQRESEHPNEFSKVIPDLPSPDRKTNDCSPASSSNALALATHCVNKWPTNWHPLVVYLASTGAVVISTFTCSSECFPLVLLCSSELCSHHCDGGHWCKSFLRYGRTCQPIEIAG